MGDMFVVRVEGVARVDRMLDWYSDRQLFNRLRRAVRAGGKPFQASLKAAAASEPTGNLPESFRKVPAPKVSASQRRGGDIVAKVRPKSPLFSIFEPGAEAHDIEGSLLGGPAGEGSWSQEGRNRGRAFTARGRVRHPGFKARPIRPIAFDAGKDASRRAVASVIFEPSR
jgi:hypothetical protein